MGDLAIPAKLATTAVRWEGEVARAWLARLPALVAELVERWDLEVGAPLEPGGNISWVAPARRDGEDLILKVQLPHPESDTEAAGLRAWDGEGAVRLIDHDPERSALLIERCRPGGALADRGGTLDAVEAGAAIGARLHAASAPTGLDDLTTRLAEWADDVERAASSAAVPDEALLRRALDTMRTRPAACTHPVLLHGDLNPTNVLSAEREPWLAIDPKPTTGDPAYDGARLVLQPDPFDTSDAMTAVRSRVDVVASTMQVDRDALLEWCLVDTVEIAAFARARHDDHEARRWDALAALVAPLLP